MNYAALLLLLCFSFLNSGCEKEQISELSESQFSHLSNNELTIFDHKFVKVASVPHIYVAETETPQHLFDRIYGRMSYNAWASQETSILNSSKIIKLGADYPIVAFNVFKIEMFCKHLTLTAQEEGLIGLDQCIRLLKEDEWDSLKKTSGYDESKNKILLANGFEERIHDKIYPLNASLVKEVDTKITDKNGLKNFFGNVAEFVKPNLVNCNELTDIKVKIFGGDCNIRTSSLYDDEAIVNLSFESYTAGFRLCISKIE